MMILCRERKMTPETFHFASFTLAKKQYFQKSIILAFDLSNMNLYVKGGQGQPICIKSGVLMGIKPIWGIDCVVCVSA